MSGWCDRPRFHHPLGNVTADGVRGPTSGGIADASSCPGSMLARRDLRVPEHQPGDRSLAAVLARSLVRGWPPVFGCRQPRLPPTQPHPRYPSDRARQPQAPMRWVDVVQPLSAADGTPMARGDDPCIPAVHDEGGRGVSGRWVIAAQVWSLPPAGRAARPRRSRRVGRYR